MEINPHVFFILLHGKIIVWDYKNHNQFELELPYFQRLIEISYGDETKKLIDDELEANGLISLHSSSVAEWGWDILSKIFHIGTQNIPRAHNIDDYREHVLGYIDFCEQKYKDLPEMTIERHGEIVQLPSPRLDLLAQKDFWSVLKNRKTHRSFDKVEISLELISTLLYCTFSYVHEDKELGEIGLQQLNKRKTSPSAGCLHSSEAYLLVLNVKGLAPGVYHYRAHSHVLSIINLINCSAKLGRILAGQYFAESLSAGVFITSRFEKSWHKYKHSRGYRNILLDIGHLSQSFQLCATALDLHPWLTGAFIDEEVCELLSIEVSSEQPMFFLGVGLGDGHCLDLKMRQILAENE